MDSSLLSFLSINNVILILSFTLCLCLHCLVHFCGYHVTCSMGPKSFLVLNYLIHLCISVLINDNIEFILSMEIIIMMTVFWVSWWSFK